MSDAKQDAADPLDFKFVIDPDSPPIVRLCRNDSDKFDLILKFVSTANSVTRAEIVAKLIEADPHQWSSRPCQTCKAVSLLLERSFGCEKIARK